VKGKLGYEEMKHSFLIMVRSWGN